MREIRKCKRTACSKTFAAIPTYKMFCSTYCQLRHNRNHVRARRVNREKANRQLLRILILSGEEIKMSVLGELAKQVCFNKKDFIKRLLDAGFTKEQAEREWASDSLHKEKDAPEHRNGKETSMPVSIRPIQQVAPSARPGAD